MYESEPTEVAAGRGLNQRIQLPNGPVEKELPPIMSRLTDLEAQLKDKCSADNQKFNELAAIIHRICKIVGINF